RRSRYRLEPWRRDAHSSLGPASHGGVRMIRIVLADDHQILLAGLKGLIESKRDMEVGAMGTDATTAIEAAHTHRPDVLVLDISMPGGGLEVARRVREMELPTKRALPTIDAQHRDVMA